MNCPIHLWAFHSGLSNMKNKSEFIKSLCQLTNDLPDTSNDLLLNKNYLWDLILTIKIQNHLPKWIQKFQFALKRRKQISAGQDEKIDKLIDCLNCFS